MTCPKSCSYPIEIMASNLLHFGNNVFLKTVKDLSRQTPTNNISPHLTNYIGRNLFKQKDHPLKITKDLVFDYFNGYNKFEEFEPLVSTKEAFDDLLIPENHICKSMSDTFYYDENTILRSQATAHQTTIFSQGFDNYILCADVYRKDEIDSTHYPVFHQIDAGKLFPSNTQKEEVENDMRDELTGLCKHLFGSETNIRWNEDSFPFTDPSFEVEVEFNKQWLEILGCGLIKTEILKNSGKSNSIGWAFGIGLERLAMILFNIPDVRLFWSQDERFLSQFRNLEGKAADEVRSATFKPFSKYPPIFKDVSMYTGEEFVENDFFDVIRGVGGDLIESVSLVDEFFNTKVNQKSKCYRITYRSMERNLTNEEIDTLQFIVREKIEQNLSNCTLR
eukprot:augustus_masked-scaffold_7-processed-gene-17.43-mRNA-1 protein AED:0.13 eAED:0.13 QI:0/-1/0/1/-1/1/1/0/391